MSLIRELPEIKKSREELEARQRERYTVYGLAKNPFPLGGNFPEGYVQYTYLEERHHEQVEDFLFSTFFRGEFNGMLILGEYGTGKSHLLRYIHELVSTDKLRWFENRALAFIIQNPSVAPENLLLELLRTIKLGTLQDLIFLPVRKELQNQYSDNMLSFLEEYTTFDRQLKLQPGYSEDQTWSPPWYQDLFLINYREFRKKLQEQNIELKPEGLRQRTRDVLCREVTDNLIIVESLVNLVFGEESKDTRSWEMFLLGSITGRKGRAVGIEYYLNAFLKLFELMGIVHIYVLVDELEDLRTQRLNKSAATEYLAALRRMIQYNYKLFSFVLASTRDAWSELKLLYPAIEDRFPIVIDLIRGSDQVKEIVRTYLAKARDGNPPQDNPWFPFSEEAIDLLIEMRGGSIVRHIITDCRKLIDIGCMKEVSAPFTTDFVREHIQLSTFSL